MKYKLTIVILMVIVLLSGSIYESISIKNTLDQLQSRLEELHKYENLTAEQVESVSIWWENEHPKLSITISHVQLNEISITLQELKGAVETEDNQSADALLLRVTAYVENLTELYQFKFINIF